MEELSVTLMKGGSGGGGGGGGMMYGVELREEKDIRMDGKAMKLSLAPETHFVLKITLHGVLVSGEKWKTFPKRWGVLRFLSDAEGGIGVFLLRSSHHEPSAIHDDKLSHLPPLIVCGRCEECAQILFQFGNGGRQDHNSNIPADYFLLTTTTGESGMEGGLGGWRHQHQGSWVMITIIIFIHCLPSFSQSHCYLFTWATAESGLCIVALHLFTKQIEFVYVPLHGDYGREKERDCPPHTLTATSDHLWLL
ncbi:hypothetical protein Fcan01_12524 [Folsomia candida]|uniref:Uncharacterized protein n=1 Tax=Folsomia candida TaxID=158441 RepID=A0A226E4A5_FOLCA|nr:hypothetical protein Fcan01_12524 [Folsomia candida]